MDTSNTENEFRNKANEMEKSTSVKVTLAYL